MRLDRIETPALIVDGDILERNVQAMKSLLEGSSLKLRPHYKSHKCAALAKLQIEKGAIGMTCSKLSELEDLVDIGVEDILVANQIVDRKKIARLAQLAGDCRLTVCVDTYANIYDLSKAAVNAQNVIHCLIEYDIGMERCGVTDDELVLSLAEYITKHPNLEFDGLQAYAGHISHIVDREERLEKTKANYEKLRALIKKLNDKGFEVRTVSGGSTGTSAIKAMEGLYTELQAGSYLFMDSTYSQLTDLPFGNSMYVLSTVVSSREGLAVVDAGVKTCGVDQGMPKVALSGEPAFKVEEIVASEEHFQLHNPSKPLIPGDRVMIYPGHCCSTVNLHDKIYLVRGNKVVDRLLITARGCGR